MARTCRRGLLEIVAAAEVDRRVVDVAGAVLPVERVSRQQVVDVDRHVLPGVCGLLVGPAAEPEPTHVVHGVGEAALGVGAVRRGDDVAHASVRLLLADRPVGAVGVGEEDEAGAVEAALLERLAAPHVGLVQSRGRVGEHGRDERLVVDVLVRGLVVERLVVVGEVVGLDEADELRRVGRVGRVGALECPCGVLRRRGGVPARGLVDGALADEVGVVDHRLVRRAVGPERRVDAVEAAGAVVLAGRHRDGASLVGALDAEEVVVGRLRERRRAGA